MQLLPWIVTLGASLAAAQASGNATKPRPDKDGKYWIESEHLRAGFVAYGAAISDLVINDKYGVPRDIVAGFDTAAEYSNPDVHPNYGE